MSAPNDKTAKKTSIKHRPVDFRSGGWKLEIGY
jgi:hypothetical protein